MTYEEILELDTDVFEHVQELPPRGTGSRAPDTFGPGLKFWANMDLLSDEDAADRESPEDRLDRIFGESPDDPPGPDPWSMWDEDDEPECEFGSAPDRARLVDVDEATVQCSPERGRGFDYRRHWDRAERAYFRRCGIHMTGQCVRFRRFRRERAARGARPDHARAWAALDGIYWLGRRN